MVTVAQINTIRKNVRHDSLVMNGCGQGYLEVGSKLTESFLTGTPEIILVLDQKGFNYFWDALRSLGYVTENLGHNVIRISYNSTIENS